MTPPPFPPLLAKNSLGRSNIFPSQSNMITSNSVQAGLEICRRERSIETQQSKKEIFCILSTFSFNLSLSIFIVNWIRKLESNYPGESDARDRTAKHVGDDSWIRLRRGEVSVEFRAVPVSDLRKPFSPCFDKSRFALHAGRGQFV